ncbi:HEPN domain-containing protein [Pseudonocardia alaniniphila]|uniref:HEPN domain-containing protein n=1 Tax=Pseudonocardia alaniniphila TaxID=75291 RepID=A0ABS9TUV9_9PSEU|nr:HEPN domain-containing protein [Pseudonocardia alaniniphila]MCH6172282.1 HEPN domain-containing protein [Pseudonocardia alaniniphila]
MTQWAVNFDVEIRRCRDLVGLCLSLESMMPTESLDLRDLMRGALVGAVSALDNLVHEVLVEHLSEVFSGRRAQAKLVGNIAFPAHIVHLLSGSISASDRQIAYQSAVREILGRVTYQRADDIAKGLQLICDRPFWAATYGKGSQSESEKRDLNLIVNRRNRIVHEADIADVVTGVKWPIDAVLTSDALDHIEKIGHDLCKFIQTV